MTQVMARSTHPKRLAELWPVIGQVGLLANKGDWASETLFPGRRAIKCDFENSDVHLRVSTVVCPAAPPPITTIPSSSSFTST